MSPADPDTHRVVCHIDTLLAARGMTQTELAERMGLSLVNLSILKNNHARAIRFTTLDAICRVLDCQPGDILRWTADAPSEPPGPDRLPPAIE